jgi:type II secretory pathway component PulK
MRYTGRSRSMVQNYKREIRFKEAAERTGVSSLEIPRAKQRHLADIRHDEPFRAAATLIAATRVDQKDVQELVDAVADARSEREELEKIESFRGKWKVAGPPPQRTATTREATAAIRKVDALLAVTTPADELAVAALRDEHEPKWRRLHDLSGQVLAAFEANAVSSESP